ncbi:DUF885 family protein [bacterium]|nr:MAG: DUF885 family protein [bacterium]
MSPLVALIALAQPDLPVIVSRYSQDRALLERAYPIPSSPTRAARLRKFYEETGKALDELPFDRLPKEDQIDVILLEDDLRRRARSLEINAEYDRQTAPLLPFAEALRGFEERRLRVEKVLPQEAATSLDAVARAIEASTRDLSTQLAAKKLAVTNGVDPAPTGTETAVSRSTANRAVRTLGDLRRRLERWFNFYNGYDPLFSWWTKTPYAVVNAALDRHTAFVRERLVGISPDDRTTIVGFPIGREALLTELRGERIPYTPEELIAIADREYAWCEREAKRASAEMGFGDDWRKALEKVKTMYVEPGKQPELIRDLAREAEEYLEKNDLVTVPPLAKETWRMEMLSPERQLQSPFFLGGENILVSYPTDTMTHEQKLMSMRGNNPYFSRATVFHELIPGHELQGFMADRYRPYRSEFGTPFFWEGNSLYWEMLLWDTGFTKTPEQRMGALFWRMHRCARVQFSLGFHLGKLTPQQCVEMLVDKVGHEQSTAEAEVRRSFSGDYGPLYQMAYLMGGLQFRALGRELVDGKKMTRKAYNDAILHEGQIPVELIRAALTNAPLKRGAAPSWRFAESL